MQWRVLLLVRDSSIIVRRSRINRCTWPNPRITSLAHRNRNSLPHILSLSAKLGRQRMQCRTVDIGGRLMISSCHRSFMSDLHALICMFSCFSHILSAQLYHLILVVF